MRNTRLFIAALAGALALAALSPACDLAKQVTAQKLMVATLFSTPAIDVSAAALSGFTDGGTLPADSGISFGDAGATLPPQTVALVFFGEREGQSLDKAPTPIDGATVALTPVGGTQVTLKGEGSGNYSKTSLDDSSFKYQGGATYQFNAVVGSESFIAEVTDAPAQERVEQFHPASGYVSLAAGSSFSFTRASTGKEPNIAFINVFPVSDKGERGAMTYSTLPKTPLDYLKLIAAPIDWKQSSFTIPGEAFPEKNTTYVILFNSVKTGGAKSPNLFIGSAILAGSAEVGLVRTQK